MPESSELAERLKAFRAHLGLSQKALSERVQVGQSTYASWETGRTVPNALALATLCELNLNCHWYLTGLGEMLQQASTPEPPHLYSPRQVTKEADPQVYAHPKDDRELTLREELRNLRETGLDKLFLLSQRGSQSGLWRVLKALGGSGKRLRLDELHRRICEDGEPPPSVEHVAADAQLLVMQDMVKESEEGGRLWYEMTEDARMRPGSHVDMLQTVREAVRSIGIEVLPALRRRDQSGYLANGELWVPDGKVFVQRLRQVLIDELQRSHSEGERVYVLVAAGTDLAEGDDKGPDRP